MIRFMVAVLIGLPGVLAIGLPGLQAWQESLAIVSLMMSGAVLSGWRPDR